MPPMIAAMSSSANPSASRASVTWTMPVASNGTGTAPSKSEPSPTCVDADELGRRPDRAADRADVVAAGGRRPEADADEAAGRGDAPDMGVDEIADRVVAGPDSGVRRDDRPGRDRQDVVDRAVGGVGDVDEHAPGLHPGDELASGGGQPALLDAVSGPAELVVEEVGRRHHPEAGIAQPIELGQVAVERMRTLDREEGRGDRPVGRPRRAR